MTGESSDDYDIHCDTRHRDSISSSICMSECSERPDDYNIHNGARRPASLSTKRSRSTSSTKRIRSTSSTGIISTDVSVINLSFYCPIDYS